jgi:hypothetical protein
VSGYGVNQGTSFAAPLVSGILGALLSVSPLLSAEDALAALRGSAVDLGDPGWDEGFGWGRVDFATAAWLVSVAAGQSPPLEIRDFDAGTNVVVTVDHRRGLRYRLDMAPMVGVTNWSAVPCTIATNAGRVLISGSATNSPGFYRVTGAFP